MPYAASVIRDSISPLGVRLLTLELVYPRVIHAEVMTYRVWGRNASSSRAIPIVGLINDAVDNPAVPIHWGRDQPGMQARSELEGAGLLIVQEAWFRARDAAVREARIMAGQGAAKQLVNRLLEPFTHIRTVITGVHWANFFGQRRHPDAAPEIHHLADLAWEAIQASTPTPLGFNEWHLPYIEAEDYRPLQMASGQTGEEWIDLARKVSTARCARVSYRLHDGRRTDFAKDLALYERLVGADPKHASPAEHQATPDWLLRGEVDDEDAIWAHPRQHGPLMGWRQHRKTIVGENIKLYHGVR